PAGERYTTAGGDDARAGNEPFGNAFPQGKLRIGWIGFAGIPYHGKPVFQPQLKVRDSADGGLWSRGDQVLRRRLRSWIREDVAVSIDQPGDDGVVTQVDAGLMSGRGHL